jgi:hypothetical protein
LPHHILSTGYERKYVGESVNMKFLGLQTEKHHNWTNNIDELIPKLSGAFYAVRSKFHVSNTDTQQFMLPVFIP